MQCSPASIASPSLVIMDMLHGVRAIHLLIPFNRVHGLISLKTCRLEHDLIENPTATRDAATIMTREPEIFCNVSVVYDWAANTTRAVSLAYQPNLGKEELGPVSWSSGGQ